MALSDIDFYQYDSSSLKPNFFEALKEIIRPNRLGQSLKYYIQNLEYFIIEKMYYFIHYFDYAFSNIFYLRKFAKSLQYIFSYIYNKYGTDIWINFRELFLKYQKLGDGNENILEKLRTKINNPSLSDRKKISIIYESIFSIQV